MTTPIRRKRLTALLATVAAAALILTGCASNPGTDASSSTPAPVSEGYPVTIETVYGEITLNEKPERIVALNGAYTGILDSLDESPVAFTLGQTREAEEIPTIYPWFEDVDASLHDPELVTTEWRASAETIAAYEPDLILGDPLQINEEIYEQLSSIAPTYAGTATVASGAMLGRTWAEDTTNVGTMLGKSDAAAEAIAEVDAAYEAGRESLAGLQGKSYMGGVDFEGAYLNTNVSSPWLDRLGLTIADDAPESVSPESLDELTADVLWIFVHIEPDGIEKLESDPRFAELPAVKNGTVLFGDRTVAATTVDASPGSELWVIDWIVQQLGGSALNTQG